SRKRFINEMQPVHEITLHSCHEDVFLPREVKIESLLREPRSLCQILDGCLPETEAAEDRDHGAQDRVSLFVRRIGRWGHGVSIPSRPKKSTRSIDLLLREPKALAIRSANSSS